MANEMKSLTVGNSTYNLPVGGAMIVNAVYDTENNQTTLDKTCEEILDAIDNGVFPYILLLQGYDTSDGRILMPIKSVEYDSEIPGNYQVIAHNYWEDTSVTFSQINEEGYLYPTHGGTIGRTRR